MKPILRCRFPQGLCLFLFFFLVSGVRAGTGDGTGLELSVSGDMAYTQGLNKDSTADEKLTMRGAELMFYAPVDVRFDGVLSVAAHEEGGETNFELHELYLASSKLLPRTNLRLGKFFLSIGRLNRFHRHDWAFMDAPKVHRVFFGAEGIFDSGLEYSLVLPFQHTFNLTAGVTSGYQFGHSHTAGAKPKVPTHYFRFSTFFPFKTTSGMDLGFSYLGRVDAHNNEEGYAGVDLTAKWKGVRKNRWLLQSEAWYKRRKNTNIQEKTFRELGLYVFNEFPVSESTRLGFRWDMFKELSRESALTGKKINNISYGATVQSSFTSSEFAKIRTTLSHEFERIEGATQAKDTRFGLQFVLILGSHPAHDF